MYDDPRGAKRSKTFVFFARTPVRDPLSVSRTSALLFRLSSTESREVIKSHRFDVPCRPVRPVRERIDSFAHATTRRVHVGDYLRNARANQKLRYMRLLNRKNQHDVVIETHTWVRIIKEIGRNVRSTWHDGTTYSILKKRLHRSRSANRREKRRTG